jgi:hypothetical protein
VRLSANTALQRIDGRSGLCSSWSATAELSVRPKILMLGRSERLPVSCDTQVGVSFWLGRCLEIVVGAIAPTARELAIITH